MFYQLIFELIEEKLIETELLNYRVNISKLIHHI